jgi:hypothetical protein
VKTEEFKITIKYPDGYTSHDVFELLKHVLNEEQDYQNNIGKLEFEWELQTL